MLQAIYTRRIGVPHESLAATRFSLTESRLFWELAHRERTTAGELARDLGLGLGLDPGYLSRLLRGLKDAKLVRSDRSGDDARHLHLTLTTAGKRAFAPLDRQSAADVERLLAPLAENEQRTLICAMTEIETLLGDAARDASPWLLRPPRPGDIDWVAERTARSTRRSTVGTCASRRWSRAPPPTSSTASIPSAKPAGSPSAAAPTPAASSSSRRDDTSGAVVDGSAQLRMLLVEPSARGLGIGARLVEPHRAVDQQRAHRRTGGLRGTRLSPGDERAAPELRPRARRRDLGAGALVATPASSA